MAVGRRADSLPSGERVEARVADVDDSERLTAALTGCEAAYYLVHSMTGGGDFASRDETLARTMARAAREAGVRRIVYLGGLGGDDESTHLESRHHVGDVLRSTGVDVVELRAAVVLGAGSASFEMLRDLTERLPVMVCPRWIGTKVQPIAETDLLSYLAQALDVAPGVYEIGGPEVTTYRDMITTYANVRGLRRRWIVKVPLLTPTLSSLWVVLVTSVDRSLVQSLGKGLAAEVIVREPSRTAGAFTVDGRNVRDAIVAALDEQATALPERLFDLPSGLHDGVYAMRGHADVDPVDLPGAEADLGSCGGDLHWYGAAFAWRLRLLLGRLFGERLRLHRPAAVEVGARVDWWTVDRYEPALLVLGTDRWFCGEAWLGYAVRREPRPHVVQVGALRPRGLIGVVYWRLLLPIHVVVFRVMAKQQAVRAARLRRAQSTTSTTTPRSRARYATSLSLSKFFPWTLTRST